MKVEERYQKMLDEVRQNTGLLNKYVFDKDSPNVNHYERLKLNISIYNDFKSSDYEIAKYLFEQEKEWRKYGVGEEGEVDNLYFSAFVLSLFKEPESIWAFMECKQIDFDSSVGFDGEYLCAAGIEKTYQYIQQSKNNKKDVILNYIGNSIESCIYTEEEIADWNDLKYDYFECFKYPIEDRMDFFYLCNEKELLETHMPNWLNTTDFTNKDNIDRLIRYAGILQNIDLEIKAYKLRIDNKPYYESTYDAKMLAILYHQTNNPDKAYLILEEIIDNTDNKNILHRCIEILCAMVLSLKYTESFVNNKLLKLIYRERAKHTYFAPYIEELITKMESENITYNSSGNITTPKVSNNKRYWSWRERLWS